MKPVEAVDALQAVVLEGTVPDPPGGGKTEPHGWPSQAFGPQSASAYHPSSHRAATIGAMLWITSAA
jgi:hypothetical protein